MWAKQTRPSVISKTVFFVDSLTPLSPFSMLKYALLTLSHGYNIKKGRGGQNVKIGNWKTHAFNEMGLFRGLSQLLLSMIVGKLRSSSLILILMKVISISATKAYLLALKGWMMVFNNLRRQGLIYKQSFRETWPALATTQMGAISLFGHKVKKCLG